MKTNRPTHLAFTPALVALAALLGVLSAPAQTVPNLISYQGYLTDATGNPLHPGAAPTNVRLEFRILDESVGGNLIWAEAQTVSVLNGTFSTLLGNGAATPAADPRPDLDLVFSSNAPGGDPNNTRRYLEVTLVGPPARTFLPRQRLVAAPFAVRAKVAESVRPGGIRGGASGDNIQNGTIHGFDIQDGAITASDLADGSVTSSKIEGNAVGLREMASNAIGQDQMRDDSVGTTEIRDNSVTASKIAQNSVGLREMASNAIGLDQMRDNSVGHPEMRDNAVGFEEMRDNAIGTAEIINGSVDPDDINPSYGLLQRNGNRYGIGTGNPRGRLEVGSASGSDKVNNAHWWRSDTDKPIFELGGRLHDLSIWARDIVLSEDGFVVVSDRRIKTDVESSDPVADLAALKRLSVREYGYKDKVHYGDERSRGFIAQEVREILPGVVSQTSKIIPDIYEKAIQRDGWIELKTDLQPGDLVRLIDRKNQDAELEVLEVAEGKFRTAFEPATEDVFVYGREVDDFLAVDYDAIAVVNVSATQQLAKEVDALRVENNELRKRLAALEILTQQLVKANRPDGPAANAAAKQVSLGR